MLHLLLETAVDIAFCRGVVEPQCRLVHGADAGDGGRTYVEVAAEGGYGLLDAGAVGYADGIAAVGVAV